MGYTDTNEENLGAFIKLLDSALQHEVGSTCSEDTI